MARFFAGLLVIGSVVLTGCNSNDDVEKKTPTASSLNEPTDFEIADRSAEIARIAQPSEPSVQYLDVDGLAPAVVVAGHPLVYTRQVLPVDAEGKLVGGDSAQKQIDQVLANLENLLAGSGSGLDRLVKVSTYADAPETIDLFQKQLAEQTDANVRPAVSAVVSPLSVAGALIAVDAVAIADDQGDRVALQQPATIASDKDYADAAVMPRGGVVYLSGQADKSPLAEATVNATTILLGVVDQLGLEPSAIVQLKVFIDSASNSDIVRRELKKKLFPDQTLPPLIFVEWISSAPIEIEAVAHFPRERWDGGEILRFYTPVGVKASPVFSKVTVVQTDRQIFISGLAAREQGGGEDQVHDVFTQLQQILLASGSNLKHLAKATYYVSDKDASDMLNKLRPEYYDPKRPPAASKAMVHSVWRVDRSISMDMIAVESSNSGFGKQPEDSP